MQPSLFQLKEQTSTTAVSSNCKSLLPNSLFGGFMEDLVQFQEVLPVASGQEFPVNARDLWRALQVGKDFSNWIKLRFQETDAVEEKDFSPNLAKTSNSNGGRPSKEYSLTIQLAKEFAMLERNHIGKQIRRYFIACEEKLITEQPTLQANPLTKVVTDQRLGYGSKLL